MNRHRRRRLKEVDKNIEACQQARKDLETRAGIAEAVKNVLEEPEYTFGDVLDLLDAEPDSDEKREIDDAARSAHVRRTERRIRELYFSVRDPELRKALIAKEREAERLDAEWSYQGLYDAEDKLIAAKTTKWPEWLAPPMMGIAAIALGYHLYGMVGALGGLLVGYFVGRYTERDIIDKRKSAIEEAEQDVKEHKELLKGRHNGPRVFSRSEERTGEPDPGSHL